MKLVIGGTALALLLAGVSGYAQEPDKDKPKEEPKKQEQPRKGEEPRKDRQEEPKQQEKPKQQPDRDKPASQPARQNDRAQQQRQEDERTRSQQSRPGQQQDRAPDQQRAHQTEQHTDRDAHPEHGNARRVPEQQYRASFGREHHFHVERRDDRRFNYGGYWFQYSDPWPSDWNYDDDVYIEDVDGEYYLLNPRRPGVRILVIVAD